MQGLGCPSCRPWRSVAFDELSPRAAETKAKRWRRQGRVIRLCDVCGSYWWVKRGHELAEDYKD